MTLMRLITIKYFNRLTALIICCHATLEDAFIDRYSQQVSQQQSKHTIKTKEAMEPPTLKTCQQTANTFCVGNTSICKGRARKWIYTTAAFSLNTTAARIA